MLSTPPCAERRLLFLGLLPLSAECNVSLCKEKPPMCPLGFEVKSEMLPGRCCPFYSCGRWPWGEAGEELGPGAAEGGRGQGRAWLRGGRG